MPERKIKAGKDAPLDPDSSAAKKAMSAEVKEAKRAVGIDEIPDAKAYDPAKHANHSHLNP